MSSNRLPSEAASFAAELQQKLIEEVYKTGENSISSLINDVKVAIEKNGNLEAAKSALEQIKDYYGGGMPNEMKRFKDVVEALCALNASQGFEAMKADSLSRKIGIFKQQRAPLTSPNGSALASQDEKIKTCKRC